MRAPAARRVDDSRAQALPIFFLDRCLGRKQMPERLRRAGVRIVVHDDHFPPDAPDDEWLPVVGAKGWIAVTRDVKIRYHRNEIEATREARVGLVVIVSKNLTGDECADVFLAGYSRILNFVGKAERPFILKLHRGGRIEPIPFSPA